MGNQIKNVGILTGGGNCPGLNSVIYGIMLKAYDADIASYFIGLKIIS